MKMEIVHNVRVECLASMMIMEIYHVFLAVQETNLSIGINDSA
jgi:hypothetical protein